MNKEIYMELLGYKKVVRYNYVKNGCVYYIYIDWVKEQEELVTRIKQIGEKE